MKINSFQPSLLIAAFIIFIPASTFAISTINTCVDSNPYSSLIHDPPLLSMQDTLDPDELSFNDWKSQRKAIRKVQHEHHIASREARKKTKKENMGTALAIAAIVPFVLFAFVGYQFCKELD